jgi:hypothetical protein
MTVFAVLGPILSCDRAPSGPGYSTGFYNDTGAQITATRADWIAGGVSHYDEAGVLSPNAEKATDGQPRPIPEKATVTWATADGNKHSKDVNVAKLIADPARFSGTIYFQFTADGQVIVVPLGGADEQDIRKAAHRKAASRAVGG